MDPLTPSNHGEEVAVFRHGLIGALALRSLSHGERSALLRQLSEQRVRPPGCDTTRCYSVPTLERWLYAFKARGLEGLVPRARADRGRGRELDPALRELLCDIRREQPCVSVTLILRTLRGDGRIGPEVRASAPNHHD
jgi:putative transposase